MTKAFIFDMDGILIDSEKPWHEHLDEVWPDLIGPDIADVFRVPVGMTPTGIFQEAVKHGSKVSEETFRQKFNEIAAKIYLECPITDGVEELGNYLHAHNYKIGVVSSSPKAWIDTVLKRLAFSDKVEAIVSIDDHPELKPKPHPGAYIEAIDQMGATSDSTLILEDSNSGIQAAKAAGCYTIGFTQHLLPSYTQHGADIYANSMPDVIQIVAEFNSRLQEPPEAKA